MEQKHSDPETRKCSEGERMNRKILFIGLAVLIIVGVVLVFVTKNASQLIKEKIEASMGKNVTVRDISLSWGGVDVSGVAITKDGDVVIKADRVLLKADFFGFLKKGYALSSLTLEKPFFKLQIDKNGELVNPLSREQKDKKDAPSASGKGEQTAFSLGELVIREGEVDFQDDRRPAPMNRVQIKNLNLRLDDLAYPIADNNSRLDVSALLEGKLLAGALKAKGDLNLKTKAVKLQGEGQRLVLLDFAGKGPVAKAESLALSVASADAKQYVISELIMKKPYLRAEADAQGKYINPFDAIAPVSQKGGPRQKPSGTAQSDPSAGAAKSGESTFLIQKMQATDGVIDYFNHKVSRPPHRTHLEAVQFTMDNLSVPVSDTMSNYSFSANTAGGTVVSKGATALRSRDTNAVLTVRNLDITQFKPYYQKKGDAAVTRGTMNLDLDLRVKSRIINSPGKIVLRNLDFASGGGIGGQIMGLPRASVVNLLKSNNNEIALDFTVQGNIDDPQFSIRESIMKKLTVGLAEKLGSSVVGAGSAVLGVGKEGVGQVGKGAGALGGGLKKLLGK